MAIPNKVGSYLDRGKLGALNSLYAAMRDLEKINPNQVANYQTAKNAVDVCVRKIVAETEKYNRGKGGATDKSKREYIARIIEVQKHHQLALGQNNFLADETKDKITSVLGTLDQFHRALDPQFQPASAARAMPKPEHAVKINLERVAAGEDDGGGDGPVNGGNGQDLLSHLLAELTPPEDIKAPASPLDRSVVEPGYADKINSNNAFVHLDKKMDEINGLVEGLVETVNTPRAGKDRGLLIQTLTQVTEVFDKTPWFELLEETNEINLEAFMDKSAHYFNKFQSIGDDLRTREYANENEANFGQILRLTVDRLCVSLRERRSTVKSILKEREPSAKQLGSEISTEFRLEQEAVIGRRAEARVQAEADMRRMREEKEIQAKQSLLLQSNAIKALLESEPHLSDALKRGQQQVRRAQGEINQLADGNSDLATRRREIVKNIESIEKELVPSIEDRDQDPNIQQLLRDFSDAKKRYTDAYAPMKEYRRNEMLKAEKKYLDACKYDFPVTARLETQKVQYTEALERADAEMVETIEDLNKSLNAKKEHLVQLENEFKATKAKFASDLALARSSFHAAYHRLYSKNFNLYDSLESERKLLKEVDKKLEEVAYGSVD